MSGHTPGPWAFLNHKDDESLLAFGIGSVEEMHDMDRFGWYSSWCMIKPEDARLIAAAPDLLEACQMIIRWMELDDGAPLMDFVNTGSGAEKLAREAVAKATGESI